eukprot:3738068-Alexandrium_andersonii.AAC.1
MNGSALALLEPSHHRSRARSPGPSWRSTTSMAKGVRRSASTLQALTSAGRGPSRSQPFAS